MIYIKHRQNKISDLATLDCTLGAEIDLRAHPSVKGKIHLSHEPWDIGDDFETWLDEYSRIGCSGPLILNTKEDGLEERILDLLKAKNIRNYFFLDTALPTLVKRTVVNSEKEYAIRFSKYEPLELAQKFIGVCDWIWVDCFFLEPMPMHEIQVIAKKFKVCLVSPELQGGDISLIGKFKQMYGSLIFSVCTKRPDLWGWKE